VSIVLVLLGLRWLGGLRLGFAVLVLVSFLVLLFAAVGLVVLVVVEEQAAV
jgi:hypothetical protein